MVALGPKKQQAGVQPPRGQAQLGPLHFPVSVAASGLPALRCIGNERKRLTPSSPLLPSSPCPWGRSQRSAQADSGRRAWAALVTFLDTRKGWHYGANGASRATSFRIGQFQSFRTKRRVSSGTWASQPSRATCVAFDLQGDRKQEIRNVAQRVFKVLESRQPEGPSLRPLLPVLSKVAGLAPGSLHEGAHVRRGPHGEGGGAGRGCA